MSRPPDNFLHVYGQYMWHEEAVIRGTKSALESLREAIDTALEKGKGQVELFATDGEGYELVVVRASTIAAVGLPEYRIHDEYAAAERAERRKERLSQPVTGWEGGEK